MQLLLYCMIIALASAAVGNCLWRPKLLEQRKCGSCIDTSPTFRRGRGGGGKKGGGGGGEGGNYILLNHTIQCHSPATDITICFMYTKATPQLPVIKINNCDSNDNNQCLKMRQEFYFVLNATQLVVGDPRRSQSKWSHNPTPPPYPYCAPALREQFRQRCYVCQQINLQHSQHNLTYWAWRFVTMANENKCFEQKWWWIMWSV